jgi:molybdate/tungstate transport system permease protein
VRYAFAAPALALAMLVTMPLVALVLGASWEDLGAAFHDADVLAAIGTSLGAALITVALALLLGIPTGYLMARRLVPGTRLLRALLDLPVVIPHPIVGVGLLLVFAKHRLLGAALREHFGLQVVSALPGIVVAMLVVSSPFVIKSAYEGFRAVPLSLERAASALGASNRRVFFTVALPLAWRSIRAGALLAWARAVSEFGSIVILAYYPRTAPVLIWDRFSAYGLRAAIAPSLLLLLVCLGIFVALQLLDQRRTVQEIER